MNVPRHLSILSCLFAVLLFASCKSNEPEEAVTKEPSILETKSGLASFYGKAFDGKKTASGEIFNHRDMVAAHPKYPLGTYVRVTNLDTQDTVHVTITDRGPTAVNRKEGVIIDVSRGAAEKLNMVSEGRVRVQVDVLQWGDENSEDVSMKE